MSLFILSPSVHVPYKLWFLQSHLYFPPRVQELLHERTEDRLMHLYIFYIKLHQIKDHNNSRKKKALRTMIYNIISMLEDESTKNNNMTSCNQWLSSRRKSQWTITFCYKTLIETLRFARSKRQSSTDHSTRQRTSSGLHIEQLLRPAAPHHTEKIYELFKQMSLKYTAAPTDRKIILAVYTDFVQTFL